MAIRKIAQMGEPVLRRVARELSREELASSEIQTLIDDMIQTMHDADGAGIAAPQVYESVQVCVMELSGNPRYPSLPALPLTVLVNPVVTPLVENPASPADADSVTMFEGCLSVNGVRGRVRRPRRVRVTGWDRAGAPVDFVLEGPLASVVQHETDHLHGVLFVDRADPRSLTFLREYDRYVPLADRIVDGGAT
ncbi:MAG TPA: peptide deformylase [Polyangiaceae bacterium]|nr:peptide deformylase [Polyangiaceae bacterium]